MAVMTLLAACAALVSPPVGGCCAGRAEPAVDHAKAAPGTAIEEVAFLAGDWSAQRPARDGGTDMTQEVWSWPSGNNMMGMFRWIGSDGESRVFEMLTITEEDDTLILRLRHQNAQGDAWEERDNPATLSLARLASADPASETPSLALFEDTSDSCDLASCEYDASAEGRLTITVKFDDLARADLVFELERAETWGAGAAPGEAVGHEKAPGAASVLPPDQARVVFDRFAAMDGQWLGRSTKGWEERMLYQAVASGSVVVERSFDAHPGEQMYTMVHMDGDRLMLTHYCVAKNQPRLVCTAWDEDSATATFEFLDATNLPSRDAGHMDKVVVRFLDDAHVTSRWTWYQDGVESWMEEIVMERSAE